MLGGIACISFSNGNVYEEGLKIGKKDGAWAYLSKKMNSTIMVCSAMMNALAEVFEKTKN